MTRKLIVIFILIIGFFGCSDPIDDEIDKESPRKIAPNFTLLSTDFEEISLSDFEGNVVLLDFWATWCKPCEKEMPIFIELYDRYRDQGFEMIGISLDDERLEVVGPFIKKLGVNYTILFGESDQIEKYEIVVLPTAVLIDRDGKIVKIFEGSQGSISIYETELKKLL